MADPHAPWQALFRLHRDRALPQMQTLMLMSIGLAILFTALDRAGLDRLLQYGTVAAASLAVLPPAFANKCRQDGTLRFLGTLPVTAGQHAASWIALCALNALPLVLLATAASARPPVNLPLAQLPGLAFGLLLFTTAAMATALALQLRTKPGEGPKGLLIALGTILVAGWGLGELFDHAPRLDALPVPLPLLLVGFSLGSTLVALALLRFAWGSIGRSVTYAWVGLDDGGSPP